MKIREVQMRQLGRNIAILITAAAAAIGGAGVGIANSRGGCALLDARCWFNFGEKVLERGCNGNPYF